VAEGVMMTVGFHPGRLAEFRADIKELLLQLPSDFHEDRGGGMSFLNACYTADDEHWGEHRNIDQLLMLGIATDQAKILFPRSMWGILLGGLPYFCVKTL
jgi:hypothetical protein